jgi:lipoprotein-anchoring transpeptidase ErfK/SrfK
MRRLRHRGWELHRPTPTSALSAIIAAVAVLAVVTTSPAGATGIDRPVVVQPGQVLANLRSSQTAMTAPDERSNPLQTVNARRPITGGRTVLPVLGNRFDAEGIEWLHVMLPGRPNGHTGWIKRRATDITQTSWHIVIELSTRRVIAYQKGRPVRVLLAVVGKPATPTPLGRFFVEESVRLRRADAGAPFALALSARSNVLQEYDGGEGQTAIHGVGNIGGVPGSAVSHGCVRLKAAAIKWLVARIGPGTPVTVRA